MEPLGFERGLTGIVFFISYCCSIAVLLHFINTLTYFQSFWKWGWMWMWWPQTGPSRYGRGWSKKKGILTWSDMSLTYGIPLKVTLVETVCILFMLSDECCSTRSCVFLLGFLRKYKMRSRKKDLELLRAWTMWVFMIRRHIPNRLFVQNVKSLCLSW